MKHRNTNRFTQSILGNQQDRPYAVNRIHTTANIMVQKGFRGRNRILCIITNETTAITDAIMVVLKSS
jgi:hypothetical protein